MFGCAPPRLCLWGQANRDGTPLPDQHTGFTDKMPQRFHCRGTMHCAPTRPSHPVRGHDDATIFIVGAIHPSHKNRSGTHPPGFACGGRQTATVRPYQTLTPVSQTRSCNDIHRRGERSFAPTRPTYRVLEQDDARCSRGHGTPCPYETRMPGSRTRGCHDIHRRGDS